MFSSTKTMTMKSISIAFALSLLLPFMVQAQDNKVVINDPLALVRNVQPFREITVSGGIDLFLSPDTKETVVVSAKSEEFRDKIVTRVTGNRLEIYFDDKKWMNNRPDMRLKVYVSFRELSRLQASGSSDVFVNGVIKADDLTVKLSGSSDFSGAIDVRNLSIEQSGSSDSRVSGRSGMVNVHVSGASDMKAFDLQTDICNAKASGSSDVNITVNKEISAEASGSSDINYRGTGVTKDIRSSGSSSIKKSS